MLRTWKRQFVLWILLLGIIFVPGVPCFGQKSHPVKASIRNIAIPSFPTGFWVSKADPHFRHRLDTLFWLSNDKIATTYFKEYCCQSGDIYGERFGAVVFNLTGKAIASHEWISMCNSPFHLGGAVGAFWVQHSDRIEVLTPEFTPVGQIPVPKKAHVIWSKSGSEVGVQEDTTLSVYEIAKLNKVMRVPLPQEMVPTDLYGHLALLNPSPNSKDCTIGILQESNENTAWPPISTAEQVDGWCVPAAAIISKDAILLSRPLLGQTRLGRFQIVRRDGTVEKLQVPGHLIGIADSSRLAFQQFRPNPIAEALDMDFGGHKEIAVYDPAKKTTVFKLKIGGQAGAAMSPDGHHLAVIEGHRLFIYSLP